MSLNLIPLPTSLVQDPRLVLAPKQVYSVLKGGNTNTFEEFLASNVNNQGFNIKCDPTNKNTITSRLFLVRTKWSCVINGTIPAGPAQTLLKPSFYAPRAYPFASVVSTQSLTLNNDTLTQANFYQYIDALMWYHNSHKQRNGLYGTTASMLDQYQTYLEGAGSNRNPLGSYDDSCSNGDIARGAFWGISNLVNPAQAAGARSASFDLEIVEPVLMSPCAFGENAYDERGFCGINNITYLCTFRDVQNLLSVELNQGTGGSGIVISSVANTLNSASMILNFFAPDLSISPIPKAMIYPYFSLTNYQSPDSVDIAPGGAVTMRMTSTSLSNYPRRIYLFANRIDASKNCFTSDAYLGLANTGNPLRMTWGTEQLFSTSTAFDLYHMSVRNGYQGSFAQWNSKTGSIICIDVGTDLAMQDPLDAPGKLGKVNVTVQLDLVNRNPTETYKVVLNMLVVDEGCLNIVDNNVCHKLGVLSQQDILMARTNPMVSYQKVEDVYGGSWSSFWSGVKNVASKVGDFIKDNKLVSKGLSSIQHPYAQAASQAARAVGLGGVLVDADYGSGVMVGGAKKRGRKPKQRGGDFEGGALMSRSDLRDRLEM